MRKTIVWLHSKPKKGSRHDNEYIKSLNRNNITKSYLFKSEKNIVLSHTLYANEASDTDFMYKVEQQQQKVSKLRQNQRDREKRLQQRLLIKIWI